MVLGGPPLLALPRELRVVVCEDKQSIQTLWTLQTANNHRALGNPYT